MGRIQEDFIEMRNISLVMIREWLDRKFPQGASPQWWQSMFESIESSVSPLVATETHIHLSDLRMAAAAAVLAVDRADIDASLGAYWLIRFASRAVRLDLPRSELPLEITPDGSAAWGLAQIQISRESTSRLIRMRKEETARAGESYFAQVGGIHGFATYQSTFNGMGLVEIEKILSVLPWIVSHIEHPALRRDVEEWISIHEHS